MKTALLKNFKKMSRYLFFLTIIEITFVSLAFAGKANSQKFTESIIKSEWDNISLVEAFENIQAQSDLFFTYSYDGIKDITISYTGDNLSIKNLLIYISSETGLSFKVAGDIVYVYHNLLETDKNIHLEIPILKNPDKLMSTLQHSVIIQRDITNQEKVVSGKVVDEKGQPLIGANILVKGTAMGTTTDIDGSFSIEVPEDGNIRLEISYIGYLTQEVEVLNLEYIEVVLMENQNQLEEVVVVGYGATKKENLTGAVTAIDENDFVNNLAPNTSQLLQGVAPNLNITLDNGSIDEEANINIRGIGSINGGQPLVLIDGVEGNLNRINPRDIASISILKDAASASIFGARAAFGVILITTKSAKSGDLKVNYTTNTGWSSPTINTDNFITDGLEWARLSDKLSLLENTSTYLGYSEEDYAYLEARKNDPSLPSVLIKTVNGKERYVHYGNTDWWETLFNNSQFSQEHNLSLTGGTEDINFYLSGRYYNREGIYKINKDILDTYTLRSKIEVKPFSWLTIGNATNIFSKSYSQPATNERRVSGSDNSEDWRKYTFHAAPLYLPTNPDGSFIIKGAYTNNRDIADGTFADLLNGASRANDQDFEIFNTTSLQIDLTSDLAIKGNYTFRKRDQSEDVRIISTPYTNQPNGEGISLYRTNRQLYKELNRNSLYQAINLYLNYDFSIGEKNNFGAVLGYNQEWNNFKRDIASRNGNLSENLNSFNLATGENIFLTSVEEEWAIRAGFYRLKYNYDERYLVEFNGRFDLASRFPTDDRLGFFPSASLAWRVSEESFWEGMSSIINSLKLRASYGSLGNQNIGAYDYISTLSVNQSNYISDGALLNYFTSPRPVSSNFTWEKSNTLDLGFDMSLLDTRFNVTFDWFRRDIIDMLTQGRQLPSVFGATEPQENAADLRTKGYEVEISWNDRLNIAGKNLRYKVGFILGDSRTHITKFDNPNQDIRQFYVGQEVGEIWGYTVNGFFQSDEEYLKHADQTLVNERIQNNYLINHPVAGDIKFLDINTDGKITPGELTVDNPGDLRIIGNSNPRYNYGITLGAEYAGFDINIFAQGIMQRDWNPGTDNGFFWGPFARQYQNFYPQSIESLAWSEDNPDAYFPRLAVYAERGGPYEGAQLGVNSDKYLQNAAYLRLKNLTIGYTFDGENLKKANIQNLRIYLTGVNLLTFSPIYENNPDRTVDPEQLGNGNDYPFSKTLAFGLNVNF